MIVDFHGVNEIEWLFLLVGGYGSRSVFHRTKSQDCDQAKNYCAKAYKEGSHNFRPLTSVLLVALDRNLFRKFGPLTTTGF